MKDNMKYLMMKRNLYILYTAQILRFIPSSIRDAYASSEATKTGKWLPLIE